MHDKRRTELTEENQLLKRENQKLREQLKNQAEAIDRAQTIVLEQGHLIGVLAGIPSRAPNKIQ